MQAFPVSTAKLFLLASSLAWAQSLDSIAKMETAGDALRARDALAHAVEADPESLPALTAHAEFLDRYGDAGARDAYARLLAALRRAGGNGQAGAIARRMALLDLLAGDADAASRDLDAYRAATGKALALATSNTPPGAWSTVNIPGPYRSFARMAAISPDARPAGMLAAVARAVTDHGFQVSPGSDALGPTEYLKLIQRYLAQARELDRLAGPQKAIRIEACGSPALPDLLRILGFRMRGGCGPGTVLETGNAARAFLTVDSAFRVSELERALREGRPFVYDDHPTAVPVLFGLDYWQGGLKSREPGDFIEAFISDPSICRLYAAFSKLEPATAAALRAGVPFRHLEAAAPVLDYFGGMFEIRDGRAMVPGGRRSEAAWGSLAGAPPDHGVQFFSNLLTRDDGWLASFYDSLARIRPPLQDYLTDPTRIERFYAALRGRTTTPGPARNVFRSDTGLMLLTTRLRLDADGKPHIPGGLEVWKNFFGNHPPGKNDGKLTRSAAAWTGPDDVLEALFALCRQVVESDDGPVLNFLAASDLDRNRAAPLSAATVDRLVRQFQAHGSQYPIFSETGGLSEQSIDRFLNAAQVLDRIHDPLFRIDATGSFQALAGLWQILVRQGTLPPGRADAVLSGIAASFAQLHNPCELFDAGRQGVDLLLSASAPAGDAGARQPQERLIALLSGVPDSGSGGPDVSGPYNTPPVGAGHIRPGSEFSRIFEAQRIIPLDTLFELGDHLDAIGKGAPPDAALLSRFAGFIAAMQAPRSSLGNTGADSTGLSRWPDRHINVERRLNLRPLVEKAAGNPEKLKEARGELAPLLRDTLVAFNYACYAPPGAQILYTSPAFVRAHDFAGADGSAGVWQTTEPYGAGSNTTGRLVGSLAALPFALAEAEQNFLVPVHTQALIWPDMAPQMMVSAKVPRWSNVSPQEMHWAALHIRYGRELLAESAFDPQLRKQVVETLAAYADPARTADVARLLEQGEVKGAAEHVTPAELFAIARELAPGRPAGSCLLADINGLRESGLTYEAVSRAFGTPKPALSGSYSPELLGLRTFPALLGYSSRVVAETWESNTLYWADLADEIHLPPAELNLRIPEWTQKVVEGILASDLEDWPAIWTSLRQVGDTERARNRAALADRRR